MIRLNTWVNCTELSRIAGCSFCFRATWQVTSQTAVICALWTPAVDVCLYNFRKATGACVRKKKVDIHAAEPPRRDFGLLLDQRLSSAIRTPVNNRNSRMQCVIFFSFSSCLFTLLWGRDSMYLQMGCWSRHCTKLSGDILPPLHKYYQIINTERPLNTWKYNNNTSSGTQAVPLKWQENQTPN